MRAGRECGRSGESKKLGRRAENRKPWKRLGGSRKDGKRLGWWDGGSREKARPKDRCNVEVSRRHNRKERG